MDCIYTAPFYHHSDSTVQLMPLARRVCVYGRARTKHGRLQSTVWLDMCTESPEIPHTNRRNSTPCGETEATATGGSLNC